MVALNDSGIAKAAFNDIGINGPLHQVIDLTEFTRLFFKDADKFLANDLTFALGICHAFKPAQEPVGRVQPDQVHCKLVFKHLFNKICLILAQQAVVNKNTGELVPHRAVHKRSAHGGVHAARKVRTALFYRLFSRVERLHSTLRTKP